MSRRSLSALWVVVALAAVFGSAPVVSAQTDAPASAVAPTPADWTPPRTPWGAPDLRGIWDYRTATPLERPSEFAGKTVLTSAEAAAYEKAQSELRADYDRSPSVHAKWWLDYGTDLTSDRRTSLIIEPADGRVPATTAAAKAAGRSRADRRAQAAKAEDRGLTERCLTWGTPRLPGAYNNNYQILQTPTHVAIVSEMIHDTRIVPLDGRPHLADNVRQWHGDSRGRYDGDTLVVETVNFSPEGAFRGATGGLRLTERFRRVGPDTVHYEFTVDDGETWVEPWTVMFPLTKTEETLYEFACHEGNHGLRNILRNARLGELGQ